MTLLPHITLLLARTARSSVYVQALGSAGLRPAEVVVYGTDTDAQPVPETALGVGNPILGNAWPDARISLEQALLNNGWAWHSVDSPDIASLPLHATLENQKPIAGIVFSGYPGQLVPQSILDLAPVLHVHGGWLPDYRGSTTVYYSLLMGEPPGASLMRLDAGLDTGQLLERVQYPPPPPGCDVDYVYDNTLRAAVLIKALSRYVDTLVLPTGEKQPEEGTTFYIIHPVLKTLALTHRRSYG